MSLQIPTTSQGYRDRIALVKEQAAQVITAVNQYADFLAPINLDRESIERCKEIVDGSPVLFKDEYRIGMIHLTVTGRIALGY